MPAMLRHMAKRKISCGQNDGLKKPSQKSRVSIQSPGVSMKPMMPLIMNRDMNPKPK